MNFLVVLDGVYGAVTKRLPISHENTQIALFEPPSHSYQPHKIVMYCIF